MTPPTPAASNRLTRLLGTIPSAASACSVRGATRIEPIADDSVAHASPIGMIGPQIAIRDIRSWSPARSAGLADIASFPWILPYRRLGNDLDKFVNVRRWFDTLKARPAVRAGVDLGRDWKRDERQDEKAKSLMFGQNSETVFKAAAEK